MNAVFVLRSEFSQSPIFVLAEGTFILGRSSKCSLVVKHDTVSRQHAEIAVVQSALTVRDLGSRNGTFIDKNRVLTQAVRVGQHVSFGSVAFLLVSAEATPNGSDSDMETFRCETQEPQASLVQPDLSKAQLRVLAMLLKGLSEKHVARQLHLSSTTVHNHIQAIYRAYKVHSRAELLVILLGERRKAP